MYPPSTNSLSPTCVAPGSTRATGASAPLSDHSIDGVAPAGRVCAADGVAASTAYSLANYYILSGEPEKARPWLQRSINVDSWSFFARIQAEADWVLLFPNEKP